MDKEFDFEVKLKESLRLLKEGLTSYRALIKTPHGSDFRPDLAFAIKAGIKAMMKMVLIEDWVEDDHVEDDHD